MTRFVRGQTTIISLISLFGPVLTDGRRDGTGPFPRRILPGAARAEANSESAHVMMSPDHLPKGEDEAGRRGRKALY